MQHRVLIKDIHQHIGKSVLIQGFVHVVRDQKAVQFVVLRDHTGLVQAVLEVNQENSNNNQLISTLTRESAVEIEGIVVENPKVRLGGVEIQLARLFVHSLADATLPIDITGNTATEVDKRLDWRFLDLRRPENNLIFQVQTTVEQAMREFWIAEGFVEIHTPKLTGSPSEGGAELFSLDYFDMPAYLTQSPQFYKQMAMAAGLDRIFEIGPVFRADPSFTSRHATEFTGVDMEMSWITSEADLMDMEERWLHHILTAVKAKHGEQIKTIFGVEVVVPALPFPRITMDEAQAILKKLGHVPPSDTKKGDLDPQGEKLLCEYVMREHSNEFVFVTQYPTDVRPFYHMREAGNPQITKSFDLLWKWMEITTGAQREHRYDILVKQATEKGVGLESIQYYLDFFKYGCPPHGGFGFGLARLLTILLNLPSIRDVVFLHRSPNRLVP
jgi:nondiscriminating aspartyl-tRNA synthetase